MNRENLNLNKTNSKLVVRFEDMSSKECRSNFHDDKEYRYSVQRADTGAAAFLYVKVDAHLAIRRANVRADDEVELVKTMRMGEPHYSVTILSDANTDAEPTRVVRPAPARQALAPIAQPVEQVHPAEQLVTRCFVVGGRSLWNAWKELQSLGCDYDQPTIEDARAAGISLFIDRSRQQQNGGAR